MMFVLFFKMNGLPLNQPLPYQGSNFIIYYTGLSVRFENTIGISVEFDGYWIIAVSIPPQYTSLTCEMCGNDDSNPDNDLVMKNGTDVGGNPNAGNLVGDSFVVVDSENTDNSWADLLWIRFRIFGDLHKNACVWE